MQQNTGTHDKDIFIAVASKEGRQIDLHFGHAEQFRIFRVGPTGVQFHETRFAEHYCQGGYGDEDKRNVILRMLADCVALFVARVGDGPRGRLQAAGIEPVDDYPFAEVEPSVLDWYQKSVSAL